MRGVIIMHGMRKYIWANLGSYCIEIERCFGIGQYVIAVQRECAHVLVDGAIAMVGLKLGILGNKAIAFDGGG